MSFWLCYMRVALWSIALQLTNVTPVYLFIFLPFKFLFFICFNLFIYYFIAATLFLFVLIYFRNSTQVSAKKYMDIQSIFLFLFSWICGLIGKVFSLLHYKVYFHGLVHDFVVCFLLSYISCPFVRVVIIRINVSILTVFYT